MSTKFGKVLACLERLPLLKSQDLYRSLEKWIKFVSTFTRFMVTKLGRVLT